MFEKIWVTPAGIDLTFHVQTTDDFQTFYNICEEEFEVIVNGKNKNNYLDLLKGISRNNIKLN